MADPQSSPPSDDEFVRKLHAQAAQMQRAATADNSRRRKLAPLWLLLGLAIVAGIIVALVIAFMNTAEHSSAQLEGTRGGMAMARIFIFAGAGIAGGIALLVKGARDLRVK